MPNIILILVLYNLGVSCPILPLQVMMDVPVPPAPRVLLVGWGHPGPRDHWDHGDSPGIPDSQDRRDNLAGQAALGLLGGQGPQVSSKTGAI